jgi:Tol biopolymer transport system component
LFFSTTTTFSQQSSGQLFEKALYMEEVSGELQKAIEIYQAIVDKFPNDRPVAAKAQFHIGVCYEKLGLKQAQQAYREVVNNYPDQQGEVAMAKERLNRLLALQEVPAKPRFRKIRIPTKPRNGVLSPDGEKLAFTSQGSVWIVPVQGKVQPDLAGEPYSLTEPMGVNNFNNSLAWSANGKWIAFHATHNNKESIYIISATGGKPEKIPVEINRRLDTWFSDRLSLSPDGKVLAFCSLNISSSEVKPEKEEPYSVYTISLDDGIIKHLTDDFTEQPAFSPDGKKIAYVKRYQSKDGKRFMEGWVIPASGGTPVRVTNSYKYILGPVWSPDSKMIAYILIKDPTQAEVNEVLIVPVSENERPLNSQKVIELPQQPYLISAGWSLDNKIGLHLLNPRHQAIYTVPLSGGKATQVTPEGWGNNPCWAPDGKRLFFRWDTGTIAFIPADGGEVSSVPIRSDERIFTALPGGGHHISPDGKRIVFAGTTMKDRMHVHIMSLPVEGGEPALLTESPTQDRFPCWSPDGKNIAFIRYHEKTKDNIVMNIYVVSSGGGEVKQITTENENVDWSSIKFSPDGNHIAYFSRDTSINMIPVQGGEPKEIVKVKSLHPHNEIIMLKDGKHMVYTSDWKIWKVLLDGGVPKQIITGLDKWYHSQIAQSPDGEKLAFTAFNVRAGDSDLWLMEDFLSDTETKR